MSRGIQYGYQIQNGELVVHPQEALAVQRIFSLYLTGQTTQKSIAETLNAERITYLAEIPAWNRLRVRRVLRNPHYAGKEDYPLIISGEDFRKAQEIMAGRARQMDRHPALCLAKKIRCEHCGNSLRRIPEVEWRDTLHFLCDHCGAKATITDADLLAEIERQAAEYKSPGDAPYTPSGEVIRLTNAINRGLERPDQPEDVVDLILKGIAARYDCFTTQMTADELLRLIKEKAYDQAIEYITIASDNTVNVTFKDQPKT